MSRATESLQGLVVVEVDDLLCMGTEGHYQVLKKLQETFTFGKFVDLRSQEEGVPWTWRSSSWSDCILFHSP